MMRKRFMRDAETLLSLAEAEVDAATKPVRCACREIPVSMALGGWLAAPVLLSINEQI